MTGVVQRLRWLGLLLLSFTCLTMGHAASLEKYDLDAQAPAANSAGTGGKFTVGAYNELRGTVVGMDAALLR